MKPLLTIQECNEVFQRSYAHGAVIAAAAFFVGSWGISIFGLLALLAILLLSVGTMYNGLDHAEAMKRVKSTREANDAVMPHDGETTEWLSHTLVRIWSAYRQSLEVQLGEQLQDFLDYNKPSWVDSFTTQGLQLGPLAPEVHHVWVMTPAKVGNFEMDLLVDISFLLPGLQWNLTATLHPVKVNVPLQVRDLLLKGKMMIKFRYQAKVPYVEKMWISFAGQPDFHFSSKVLNLLQMNDVPLLRTFLDNLIQDSLKLNMVHPQRWLMDLNSMWHGAEKDTEEHQHPMGILVVYFPASQYSITRDTLTTPTPSSPDVPLTMNGRTHTETEYGPALGERIGDSFMETDEEPESEYEEEDEGPRDGPLVQFVHRADMKLSCWLAPTTGSGRRTLLVRSLPEDVKLILKARTDDGQEIWSTGKLVDTSNITDKPTRLVFCVKGKNLVVEVRYYPLKADGSAAFFNLHDPTVTPMSSPLSSIVHTGSVDQSLSNKVPSPCSTEDVRNFRKKIDDKMSNMVNNTLKSLVRSKDKTTTLGSFMARATQILKSISIPAKVFNKARGVVVMSVFKVGLVLGVRSGAGTLFIQDEEGWSAPTALWIGGMSAGLEGGAQSVDIILVINNEEGLDAFCKRVLVLGMDVPLVAGPQSDDEADCHPIAPCYWYTFNKNAAMSLSLRGSVLTEHRMLNRRFYGRNARAMEILQSRPMRELPEVQSFHVTLHDIDTITGADDKAAPQKFLDMSTYSGASSDDLELGGCVHLTVQSVSDVSLPESAELSCLIHRGKRLVGQCHLDRQGAGEWAVSNSSAANIYMVVSNSTCCILQLTVVSKIDDQRQVVGSTAMDVYTFLNSVESVDGKIVLQLGPSMPQEEPQGLGRRQSMRSRRFDWDSRASSGEEDNVCTPAPLRRQSAATQIPRIDCGLAGVEPLTSGTHSPTSSQQRLPTAPRGSFSSSSGNPFRSARSIDSDVSSCSNTLHTAEWLYSFVHQYNLCRDFKHHLRTIPNCFMGRELVDQLTCMGHFDDRQSAITFLQTLLPSVTDEGVVHVVGGEGTYFDDKKTTFFRFFADEMTGFGKGGKDRKYNIPGFSHDESATVHWQKWLSRRDGNENDTLPIDNKSDKLIKRSFEAARDIIMRNRKKDLDGLILPEVHCLISFRKADGLAIDLDDQNTASDDFLPYMEPEKDVSSLLLSPRKVLATTKHSNPLTKDTASCNELPTITSMMAESLILQQPASLAQDQVISLTVMIKQGRNLKPKGVVCDAYVKVKVENEKVYRTKTCKKATSPQWDEEFKVKMISRLNGSIDFQVKDWNPISDDTILGNATLYLESYFGQDDIKGLISKTVHLPLAMPGKKAPQGLAHAAQLTLRLTAQPGMR